MADVLVAGAGPAGWVAAFHCARLGLETVLVAPHPHAVWRATYGLWADQCRWLPAGSRWITADARAVAVSSHALRRYAVLDNDSVHAAHAHPEVRVVADGVTRIHAGPRGCGVELRSGRTLAASVVVDATGPRAGRVEQTAFGVVVSAEAAAPLLAAGEALFMDWRTATGTFLYAVPLPGGGVLVEETSLASRPGLGFAELRDRLRARLASHGIGMEGTVERVRIPLDVPVPGRRAGVIPFGAAGGLVHPASGYSVADSFRLAPGLAAAIADARGGGPEVAVRAGRHAVWPAAARAVHLLRRRGLAVLLALPPERLAEFFELFFSLPDDLQRAYLSGREDLRETAKAMGAIFRAADPSMRTAIARFALIV